MGYSSDHRVDSAAPTWRGQGGIGPVGCLTVPRIRQKASYFHRRPGRSRWERRRIGARRRLSAAPALGRPVRDQRALAGSRLRRRGPLWGLRQFAFLDVHGVDVAGIGEMVIALEAGGVNAGDRREIVHLVDVAGDPDRADY